MSDKPKTTEEQIAELSQTVSNLEQRLQVVSSFAARMAAQLRRQGTFIDATTDNLLKAVRPPSGQAGAAGFQASQLEQIFQEYLATGR